MNDFKYKTHTYEPYHTLEQSLYNILKKIYRYNKNPHPDIIFSNDIVESKFYKIANNPDYRNYDICIAKTQYSMNDDPAYIPVTPDTKTTFTINNIEINNGAELIVISAGNIMRMPGLPKEPNACHIDFIENKIVGLS